MKFLDRWDKRMQRVMLVLLALLQVLFCHLFSGRVLAQDSGQSGFLLRQIEAWNRALTAYPRTASESIRSLLTVRAAAMSSLMEADPARALSLMLPQSDADRLRANASPDIIESEGEWSGTATVIVGDDFVHGISQLMIWLTLDGTKPRVHFAGGHPEIKSGDIIRIRGVRLGNAIVAKENSVIAAADSPNCPTTGQQKIAALLVNMPGAMLPSAVTPSFVDQILFASDQRSLDNYWREASNGNISATGSVFGPFSLPNSHNCFNDVDGFSDLIAVADSTVDFRNYNRIILIVNDPACNFAWGTVGCQVYNSPSHGNFKASVSLVRYSDYGFTEPAADSTALYVIVHELGHNLGLLHADTLQFGTQALGAPGDAGTDVEYGDWFSNMGQLQGAVQPWTLPTRDLIPHWAAPHKHFLGWLSAGEVQDVQSSGTFVLQPFEMTSSSGLKALRLRRGADSDQYLWIEYRQPIGYDAGFGRTQPYGGALIHLEDPARTSSWGFSTHLLDFTASATPGDFQDAALVAGETWTDPYGSLSLTVNSATTSGLSVTVNLTTNNIIPTIASVSPTTITAGSAAFTLWVNGANFLNTSSVQWNGVSRATNFVSNSQLTASILASDIATAGTANITVVNPSPDGGTSNARIFTINNPLPILTSISPSVVLTGISGFMLMVNGMGFVSSSLIRWNGLSRSTTFVSSTQLSVAIVASDVATAGSSTVTVVNPEPGGGTSSGLTFTANNPAPSIATISPASTIVGSGSFTLSVSGSNFIQNSVIRWNSSDRTTTYLSNARLTAAITASDIAVSGVASITIFNPAPGGGTSNSIGFPIVDCSATIQPEAEVFEAAGGTGSVDVLDEFSCSWTAISGVSWIMVTSGGSGTGPGRVNYSVTANIGARRTGMIAIAGRTFTVTQLGVTMTESVIVGLGQFGSDGGWMSLQGGSGNNFSPISLLRLPWAQYNATGGGVHVATGDLDGDGLEELIVGFGAGGNGWIAVLDDSAHNNNLLKWIQVAWTSYNSSNGEVFPAVGDLDGDGKAEIVAGLRARAKITSHI